MSHVATIDINVTDLGVLAEACHRIGLELILNQKTYKWYGRHVGDYPIPEGFTIADLGNCEHAIRVKGDKDAYEVGVVKRRDGKPGYTLLWDFYDDRIVKALGPEAGRLKQSYAVTAAQAQAVKQGFRCVEQKQANGSVRLVLTK